MSKTLRFTANDVVVTNLNPRAENHGEDGKVAACDINLQGLVSRDILHQLTDEGEAYLEFLWLDAAGDSVRELGLSQLKLAAKLGGQAVKLSQFSSDPEKFNGIELDDVIARGFKFTPKSNGNIELAWQVQTVVSDADWRWLRKAMVADAITVEFVAPPQADLVDEPEHARRTNGAGEEAGAGAAAR